MRRHLIEMLNKAIIIVITTTLLLLWLYLPLASHFLRILRVKHRPKWEKVFMRLWSYRSWGMKVVFSWKNATRLEVIYWNELSEWNTCDSGATRLRNKWTRGKQRSKGLLVPFEPKLKHTTMDGFVVRFRYSIWNFRWSPLPLSYEFSRKIILLLLAAMTNTVFASTKLKLMLTR